MCLAPALNDPETRRRKLNPLDSDPRLRVNASVANEAERSARHLVCRAAVLLETCSDYTVTRVDSAPPWRRTLH